MVEEVEWRVFGVVARALPHERWSAAVFERHSRWRFPPRCSGKSILPPIDFTTTVEPIPRGLAFWSKATRGWHNPNGNIASELKRLFRNRVVLYPLQSNGDRIAEMLSGSQLERLRHRLANTAFDAIVFSGGGNDIVGSELEEFITPPSAAPSLAADWRSRINEPRFALRLSEIRAAYLKLIELRDAGRNPLCPILVHGYDYPFPSPRPFRLAGVLKLGPWLYPTLTKLQVPPEDRPRIARWLIERFNAMLAELASAPSRRFHHIQTAGTLQVSEWSDEIHPTAAGFAKIAACYRPTLQQLLPQAFV